MDVARRVVLAAVVATGASFGAPGAASAHESSYCGHASSGSVNLTIFAASWSNAYAHYHERDHYTFDVYVHDDVRMCGDNYRGHY